MNEHDGDEADDDNDDEYIKYCWHKSPVKGGFLVPCLLDFLLSTRCTMNDFIYYFVG